MNQRPRPVILILVSILLFNAPGCETQKSSTATPTPSPTVTPSATPTPTPVAENEMPVTLPMIDAFFFGDERFATDLKAKMQMTDEQISRLRVVAREETAKLRESSSQSDYQGSTIAAAELTNQRLIDILGEEKARQLTGFVSRRLSEGSGEITMAAPNPNPTMAPTPASTPAPSPSPASPQITPGAPSPTPTATPSAVNPTYLTPIDTRIIVNAPAYRMDIFADGRLIKSYKIGIGYPEFPIPTGLRQAKSIIFNPTWTPPDEPWVESSNKVKVGERIESGSKLNPLGVIKIPIGLPSLIHGGKAQAKLGGFASHGCVGLTDKQVQDFAKTLAGLSGIQLSDEEIARYEKNRTKTGSVKLDMPIPVELRYETIVVEDGKLRIYRDVYERGTNTRENLSTVLAAYNVTIDQLSEEERAQIDEALGEMSRSPAGASISETTSKEKSLKKQRNVDRGKVTRGTKGEKEVTIEVAALAGKGYPAPTEINTGGAKPPVIERASMIKSPKGNPK